MSTFPTQSYSTWICYASYLPAQMWQRVAQGVAAVEAPQHQREWADKFA
jgi:hypothetical protein